MEHIRELLSTPAFLSYGTRQGKYAQGAKRGDIGGREDDAGFERLHQDYRVIIKEPAVYDTSHWKEILDFSAITPRPVLMLTKATEAAPNTGYNHTDDKFVRFFAGMKQAGIRRGCFHFFRKSVNSIAQAQHFVQVINPHVDRDDILVLDIEEGGETAKQIITFCDYVQSYYPNNIFMIYSRKTVLDMVTMTQMQKDRLKQIPTWVAGYPYFPDLYSKIPRGYIPDQTRWGNVWLWQYSESGAVEGIKGAVDLNWIEPVFYEMIRDIKPRMTMTAMFPDMTVSYKEA